MPANKKKKLHINVHQVGGIEQIHTLLPVTLCIKAGANLFSLTCKFLKGNKIKSDHKNKIVVHTSEGNLILDCCIKTHDCWIAGVEFLQETGQEMVQLTNALPPKNVNSIHAKLGHSSKVIVHTTAKSMGIQVTGTFKPCEDCAWGKAKKGGVSKKAIVHSNILWERLFFDISSPSTPTFGGKKHWLLVWKIVPIMQGTIF